MSSSLIVHNGFYEAANMAQSWEDSFENMWMGWSQLKPQQTVIYRGEGNQVGGSPRDTSDQSSALGSMTFQVSYVINKFIST